MYHVCSPEHRGVGNVMVYKLPPLHHIVGVQLTGGVHIGDNVDTDQPGGGESGPCLGHLGSPHPVTVLGQQRPLEGGVS